MASGIDANYAALLIAVLYPSYVSPEQAFNLYTYGTCRQVPKSKEMDRMREIIWLRLSGMSWNQIAETLGLKNGNSVRSYYSHRKRILDDVLAGMFEECW